MCGILGIFNDNKANEKETNAIFKVKEALKIIKNRGKDMYGIANENDFDYQKKIDHLKLHSKETPNAIAHCLHSLVSFVPQPLISENSKNRFIVNCEIYNWEELNETYKLNAKNDAEMLFRLIEKKGKTSVQLTKILDELEGVYAFAFWDVKKRNVVLARDIIGVKPIWFSLSQKNKGTDSFAFSSEKKALEHLNYNEICELNPRKILVYNIKTKKITQYNQPFFSITPELKKPYDKIKKELAGFLTNAVSKRIPDREFGILFSGGVDSTFIAFICKSLGLKPVLYTSVLETKGTELKIPEDYLWARKAARELKLKLKINKIKLEDIENYLKYIVPLIEDSNVVKVGVALTFYGACELARKDNVKVIFSGLGSEEILAGYERHKKSAESSANANNIYANINKECLSGLLKMYERDLYRDDVITMNNSIELRLPFLDKKLVEYALTIPAEYKLNVTQNNLMASDNLITQNKLIFREIAKEMGVPSEFAERKKRAAQYGSSFDKAIEKLAKQNGFKLKSEYLDRFLPKKIMKLGVLFSSGKDSNYALHIMKNQNYDIACLITIKSKNPASYMFHTPNINIAKLQAEALQIPLIEQITEGEKEEELKDLKKAIEKAKEEYKIEGLVTGAIFSTYQRDRIEKICDELGLKIFSPLWHMEQEKEVMAIINNRFDVIIGSIAADGLSKEWLGKKIDNEMIEKLKTLHEKNKINIAFEGGEAETLVLDAPLYKKKIKIEEYEIVMENEYTGRFVVKKAKLVGKSIMD